MNPFRALLLSSAAVAGLTAPTIADDWVATKLRGLTFVHNNGEWQPLKRGDAVTELDVVRTLPSGRAEFTRGTEIISLSGESQIRIEDAASGKFTTVHQTYGKVTVDADKANVQHFAVHTPFLAAVVKGTVFSVTVRNGRAEVSVNEGRVQVQDTVHQVSVDVLPGQSAKASDTLVLAVSGRGQKEPVLDASGAAVPAQELALMQEQLTERGRGSENGNVGNGNRGGNEASPRGNRNGNSPGSKDAGGDGKSAGKGNSGGNGSSDQGNSGGGSGNSGQGGSGGGNGNSGNSGGGHGNSGGGEGNGNSGGKGKVKGD